MTNMEELRNAVRGAKQIVIVCGAGISTGAGLPDFKNMYKRNPELLQALNKRSYKHHTNALSAFLVSFANKYPHPTSTHYFMKALNSSQKLRRCYTMNIDNLETLVLPKNKVRHVHGSISDAARCGRMHVSSEVMLQTVAKNKLEQYNEEHKCSLRPGFVMYGDDVRHTDEMQHDLQAANLILVIGTRLQVEPVASIVRAHSQKIICINNETIPNLFTVVGDCNSILDLRFFGMIKMF